MNTGQADRVAGRTPLHAFETFDQLAVEVRREQDSIWVHATGGKLRRVMPLYSFVAERAQIAAQARNEALAASFASLLAAAGALARGVRRLFRSLPDPQHHPNTVSDINNAAVNPFAFIATNSWRSS